MPEYRRLFRPGGTYFFTLVTVDRRPFLCDDLARFLLHESIAAARTNHPFHINGIVLMPDHLHMMITLPEDDQDFSHRLAAIKAIFTHDYLAAGGRESLQSASRRRHRHRGVWQRRFWEHLIRDQDDFNNHLDYIHYNPVKHSRAACPHAWAYSSFKRWVSSDGYEPSWQCICDGQCPVPPRFQGLGDLELE